MGNNAVHPGVIDVKDNQEIAIKLFNLVNLIADEMITQSKKIDAMFEELPTSAKEGIAKRDGKTS